MDFGSIFHISTDNMCYPLNQNQLAINIKTGYDVEKVVIHYGDPFTCGIMGGKESTTEEMLEIKTVVLLAHHKLWKASVSPKFKRCRYFFELFCGSEIYYMFEDGFKTPLQLKQYPGRLQYFFFPWMNVADIYSEPKWVNKTIWYQIFPDRFCKGGSGHIKKDKCEDWREPNQKIEKGFGSCGGDIAGIIQKLPYLKYLGITGIYLTPINQSNSNHKYSTDDYLKIDSDFGTNRDMKDMVKKAHENGIKVMLDGVFNHCGENFAPWRDVVEKGQNSKYFDWFFVNKWPFSKLHNNAKQGNYYSFAFFDGMPKLNTNNSEVIEYLLNVCEFWVNEYNIDALRLDVANELSHEFCKQLNKRMKSIKSDFYILGEIWHNSMPWLRGDEFDSVMNYVLQESINDFWQLPGFNAKDFAHSINNCYSLYMRQTNNIMFNLLDSHDTMRLITKLNGDKNKFYQNMAVLFTMPGSVCIYYGSEIVLEGGYDPDNRRPMPWEQIESGNYSDSITLMRKLIYLRKTYDCLRNQNIKFIFEQECPRVIIYNRFNSDDIIQIVINGSHKNYIVNTSAKNILFALNVDENVIKPDGVMIYKIK